MAQPIQAGSYTALFSQKLMETIIGMAATSPLTAVPSPFVAQMDANLLGNVQQLDGMLSLVGIGVNTGFGPAATPGVGVLGAPAAPGLGAPIGPAAVTPQPLFPAQTFAAPTGIPGAVVGGQPQVLPQQPVTSIASVADAPAVQPTIPGQPPLTPNATDPFSGAVGSGLALTA